MVSEGSGKRRTSSGKSGSGELRSRKPRRKESSGNNGLLIGGGIAALVVVAVIAFMAGQGSGPQVAPPVAVPPVAGPAVTPQPSTPAPTVATAPSTTPTIPTTPQPSPPPTTPVTTPMQASTGPAPTPSTDTPPATSGERPEMEVTDLIEQVDKSIVRVRSKQAVGAGVGSGFVVDAKEGIIVTNYHVIEESKSIDVEFANGDLLTVEGFYGFDDERDIALLKVIPLPSMKLQSLPLASSVPKKGEKVLAFGAPLNLGFTSTQGIVSQVRDGAEVDKKSGRYIQTDAAINPGNSGGPLVNLRGEVVGINSFMISGAQGLGFAVSSTDVEEVLTRNTSGSRILTQISPAALPAKYGGGGAAGAIDVSTQEKGRFLLGTIQEAGVLLRPFPIDPTDRVTEYVRLQAMKAIDARAKISLRRLRDWDETLPSIILISCVVDINEEVKTNQLPIEFQLHMVVYVRDTDKDGVTNVYKVWDEKKPITTVAISALANGQITRTMGTEVPKFFSKFTTAINKAKKEFGK